MNRRFYLKLAVLAMLVCGIISCKKEVKVTSVQLNETALTLYVGDTATIIATIQPADAAERGLNWSSNNNNVASVWNGTITAKSEGTATITATTRDGNKTAQCKVTVINSFHPAVPEMVWVEGGTFTMGCTDGELNVAGQISPYEIPTHQVTLSSFKMAKYLVTQKQWELVMGTTINQQREKMGYSEMYGEGDNYPMYYVSWQDAQDFINKLNELTRKKYRLPTEAEWEFAARGGNNGKNNNHKYSGGNDIDAVAWYYDEYSDSYEMTTKPVGTKAPNELGIYDMSGNLWEFCSDLFEYYTEQPQTNPVGRGAYNNHVIRGGCFGNKATQCRVSYRRDGDYYVYERGLLFGIRLVLVE